MSVETLLFCPAYENFGSATDLVRMLYNRGYYLSQDEKDLAASTLQKVVMAEGVYLYT